MTPSMCPLTSPLSLGMLLRPAINLFPFEAGEGQGIAARGIWALGAPFATVKKAPFGEGELPTPPY
jgi:hypothetical protein